MEVGTTIVFVYRILLSMSLLIAMPLISMEICFMARKIKKEIKYLTTVTYIRTLLCTIVNLLVAVSIFAAVLWVMEVLMEHTKASNYAFGIILVGLSFKLFLE